MKKNIIVNVGRSLPLQIAIQHLLLSSGCSWGTSGSVVKDNLNSLHDHREVGIQIDLQRNITSWEMRLWRAHEPDNIFIDAATEIGKLIDLLEQKEIIIEDLAQPSGGGNAYIGTISPNGKSLTVGCSTILFEKVEEVYLKMREGQS